MFLHALFSLLVVSTLATPTPAEKERRDPQSLNDLLDDVANVLDPTESAVVSSVVAPLQTLLPSNVVASLVVDATNLAKLVPAIATAIEDTLPTHVPDSIEDAVATVASIFQATPTDIYENTIQLVLNDFVPGDIHNIAYTYSLGCNADVNSNTRQPSKKIYPKKSSRDAPYSLSENALRAVIHIPSSFTYGRKQPVIGVPGTGSTGCLTFESNFFKLWQNVDYADPVWLNIPDFLLDDAQVSAEYIAYAINYISAISSNKNVSVIAWSQGNLDTQWAFKYWPSTRSIVNDFISISPDFHGTVLAYVLCPGFPTPGCVPSVIQQTYQSKYVTTLRANGGDSAYVPTTTIYSATDEIVQPQQGADASAIIKDARGVGVSNNEVQVVCNGMPAGLVYTHEGVLYNPLAFALAVDALTHKGPGRVSRLNLNDVCSRVASPGLSLGDVLATEGTIVVAVTTIALYLPKVANEPPIKAYAR